MIRRVHISEASNTTILYLHQERKVEEKTVIFVNWYNKTIMAIYNRIQPPKRQVNASFYTNGETFLSVEQR